MKQNLEVVKQGEKYLVRIYGADGKLLAETRAERWQLIDILETSLYRIPEKRDPILDHIIQSLDIGATVTRYEPYWFIDKSGKEIPMVKAYYKWKGSERFTNLRLLDNLAEVAKVGKTFYV